MSEVKDCQCPICGRMHRHLGNPPVSVIEQIARDMREGTFPKKSEETLREEASVECPHCRNANEYGDYEGPSCDACGGVGFIGAPRRLSISEAWPVVKRWLDSYSEEEQAFSKYRDDVILDGVMTAIQRRAISAALSSEPIHDDDRGGSAS